MYYEIFRTADIRSVAWTGIHLMSCYRGIMAREITIDSSGRLVVPKDVRERHHLEAGSRLTLIDRDDGIVLVPRTHEPRLVERDGLLVVSEVGPIQVPDHRDLREDRLQRLGTSE